MSDEQYRALVAVDARLDAYKASFGGDRSAAGRYAAEQRWKGHQKKDEAATGKRSTDQKLSEGPTNLLFGRDANGMPVMGTVKQLKDRYGKSAKAREEYFRTRYGIKLKIAPAKAGSVAEAVQMGSLQALEEIALSTNLDRETLRGVQIGDTGSDPHYDRMDANGSFNNGYISIKPETIEKRLPDLLSKVRGMQINQGVGLKPSTETNEEWYGSSPSNIPDYSISQMFPSIPAVDRDTSEYFADDRVIGSRVFIYREMAQRAGYAVMVHEFGHAVDFGGDQRGNSVSTQSGESWDKLESPTQYGRVNQYEKAAESFAAWWLFGGGQGNLPRGIRGIGRLANPILGPILEARGDLVKNALPHTDIAEMPLNHPVVAFILAPLLNPVLQKARVKVDAMIAAAFSKASFGGDRSAAGRYAAEQRWKDHVKAEPKREQVFSGNLEEAVDKTVAAMTGVPRNEMTDFMRQMGASWEGSIAVLYGELEKILGAKHSPAEILAAKLATHALLKVGESFKHQHEDKAIDAYGRVAHLPAVVNAKTVEELITAIENTPEFQAGEENMVSLSGLVRERLKDSFVGHAQGYRHTHHIISGTIGYWNMGGASKKSIWQEIVAREFGLTEERPNKPETAHAAEVGEILDQRLPGSAGVFRTMARAVYEQAQMILRQSLPAGTTHVMLHRGTGLTDKELQDAENGSLRIAPITSFSTDLALTERYGAELKQEAKHTVGITVKVPVSQIFGLFAQKFGYLSEKEVVVLGPSVEVETVTMRDIMQKVHARVDAMVKARPESAWRRGYDTQYLRRREQILGRRPMCSICGKRRATEIDHAVPLIQGGKRGPLRAACRSCNAKKGGAARRLSKASFGGDRSAAGRYAAEQRWKGHVKQSAESHDGSSSKKLSLDELKEILGSSANAVKAHEAIAKRLGKTMKPKVEDLSDDDINAWRAVSDNGAKRLVQGKIKNAEWATYGQGLYVMMAGQKGEGMTEEYAKDHAFRYGKNLIGLRLGESAKIVDGATRSSSVEAAEVRREIEKQEFHSTVHYSHEDFHNLYWASQGFDGWQPSGRQKGGEVLLFNAEHLSVNKADLPPKIANLKVKKSLIRRDAVIAAALAKASFGGDRSAAGRYAAEQRWKDHVKRQDRDDARRTVDEQLAQGPKTLAFGRDAKGLPIVGTQKQLEDKFGKTDKERVAYFKKKYGVTVKFTHDEKKGENRDAIQVKLGALQALDDILSNLRVMPTGFSTKPPISEIQIGNKNYYDSPWSSGAPPEAFVRTSAKDGRGFLLFLDTNRIAQAGYDMVAKAQPMTQENSDDEGYESPLDETNLRREEEAAHHSIAPRFGVAGYKLSPTATIEDASTVTRRMAYAVMVHEFGHVLDTPSFFSSRKDDTGNNTSTRLEEATTPKGVAWRKTKPVSEYAGQNEWEKMAEGFAAWFLFSQAVGRVSAYAPKTDEWKYEASDWLKNTTRRDMKRLIGPTVRPLLEALTPPQTAEQVLKQVADFVTTIADLRADHPIIVFAMAASSDVEKMKATVRRDAMVSAALAKASFGGDRSAAGRYAAEQRWKDHVKSDKPVWRDFREVLATMPRDRREVFADRVREQASQMTDEELEREWKSIDPIEVLTEDEGHVGIAIEESIYAKIRKKTLAEEMARRKVLARQSGIMEHVRRENGMSVSMETGEEPKQGFMVARKEGSVIVDAAKFFDAIEGKKVLSDFIKANRERLGAGVYLGIWHNKKNGKVYLDVVDNVIVRGDAERMGRERNQIAIWDVVNKVEIQTGGTGEG